MRYIVMQNFLLSIILLSPAAQAATAEDCVDMARNYILTMEQSESIKDVIYAREKFMLTCNKDDAFAQELISLVIENKALKAVHVRPLNKRKSSPLAI